MFQVQMPQFYPIFTTQHSVLLKDDEAPEEVEEVVEPRPFLNQVLPLKNT